MALTNCPECRHEVSDRAATCPGCGHPLVPQGVPRPAGGYPYYWGGYEYKSKATIFGMPLVHIAQGFTPEGRFRVAKGFIAIGNVAVGVIAVGGVAIGIYAVGGLCLGPHTIYNDPNVLKYRENLFQR